jgi:hypothetical protein
MAIDSASGPDSTDFPLNVSRMIGISVGVLLAFGVLMCFLPPQASQRGPSQQQPAAALPGPSLNQNVRAGPKAPAPAGQPERRGKGVNSGNAQFSSFAATP